MSYQQPDDLALIPEPLALAPAVGKPSSSSGPRASRALMSARDARGPEDHEEIAEAAFVAAAVRAGGTLAHALLSLRLRDSPEK